MEIQEREKYIALISSGTVIYEHKGQRYYIKPPTPLIKHESYIYKDSILSNIVFDDLFDNNILNRFLLENNIIFPEIDAKIDELVKNQESLKVEACENWMDSRRVDFIKKSIAVLDKQINQLYAAKHSMDYLTKDGYSELCRIHYLIINSTFDSNGSKINVEDDAILVDKLLSAYNSSLLSVKILRELARTEPWNSIYSNSKNPFGCAAISLTENQKGLLAYTRMYANVFKHPESPNEKIINDDDLLDGWLIIQRRKNVKESTTDKFNNAQEVYFMAKDKETIQNIRGMNSATANAKKAGRLQQIKNQGKVKEIEFVDVQKELRKG